jgi:copper chaperone
VTERTLSVPDISCDHCKMSIEQAVAGLAGVDSVAVDIAGRSVDFSFDEMTVDLDRIIKAIEEVGYEVAR